MKNCENCGESFQPTRNSKGRFCGRKCAGEFSRTVESIVCAQCEKLFRPKESGAKFCSRSCSATFNNKASPKRDPEGTCSKCGVPASKSRKFCLGCWEEIVSARAERPQRTKRKKRPQKVCGGCGVEAIGPRAKLCVSCRFSGRTIDDWLSGVWDGADSNGMLNARVWKYLMSTAGGVCQSPSCPVPGGFRTVHPVTGRVPLEVDHIDGDASNHSPDNLIVICACCHSLTPTYRALNKSSKRIARRSSEYSIV